MSYLSLGDGIRTREGITRLLDDISLSPATAHSQDESFLEATDGRIARPMALDSRRPIDATDGIAGLGLPAGPDEVVIASGKVEEQRHSTASDAQRVVGAGNSYNAGKWSLAARWCRRSEPYDEIAVRRPGDTEDLASLGPTASIAAYTGPVCLDPNPAVRSPFVMEAQPLRSALRSTSPAVVAKTMTSSAPTSAGQLTEPRK